jgi:uncharacterized protein YbcC (UPF0753/DUF2309 family)
MEEEKFLSLINSGKKQQLQKIEECNQYTRKFGVSLSQEEALQLLESRKASLKQEERIEFGEGILSKLIFTFCDSPYIFQDNYVQTIEALQDIFYLFKNESLDELSDDELLTYMKDYFDGECEGDLEFLEGTCLDNLCRNVRSQSHRFIGADQEDE